ncbi:recombinase family protein [Streptomyces sp. NPDC002917]|uniref:recombinase family protein n=1 Tax=Streptomyces sp. NPDC002917 TaxID=3364671 RepID=UPI003682B4CA
MTKRRPRASLYARLSVAADAENVSLEGMVADMRALAEREGLEILEPVHVDDGRSGGFRDRDEFTAWLDDARSGRAEVLMAYHTDRLTREGLNVAASILDVVEGKNPDTGRPAHRPVRLLDCSGIDSAQGDAFRFRFVMQAEIGRSERERIRQRSRDRARRLSRAGRWGGGAVPFGYRAVDNPEGPGKVLTIEPAEAAAIRDAADAVLSGDPLNRVARRMNHEGIKPRRAAAWSRVTLTKLLTSEHVLGRVSEGGRPLRDADGEILTPWPPILTVSQVAALRAELAPNPSAPYSGGRQPTRLLSGLLSCHDCGSTLQVARRKSRTANPEPVIMYRCTTRSQGGVCGAPVATTAGPIEEHVSARYLAAAGPMPMYRERTIVSGAEELATVEAELRDILADMATAATPENFARLQALQVRREELAEQAPERRTEMVPTGRTMAEHWQRSMVDDRRALLADAFAVMTLRPGKRGPKGFDAERLVIHWADTVDAE